MITDRDIEDLKVLHHSVNFDGNKRGADLLSHVIEELTSTDKQAKVKVPDEEIMDILKLRAEIESLKVENERLKKKLNQKIHDYGEDVAPNYSKYYKRPSSEEEEEAQKQSLREEIYRVKEQIREERDRARYEMKKEIDRIKFEEETRKLRDINTWLGKNNEFS